MAVNNYDGSFETYNQSDIAEAEVQNMVQQTNAIKQYVSENAQTPIVQQPTTPPLNPKKGDMWIDESVYPNVIYSWNGTQWNRAGVTSASEVGAYTTAQVDSSQNNIQIDLNATKDRVTNVENKTTDSAIINVVTSSQEWTNKADASALGDYVKTTTYNQNNSNIQAMFAEGGGINLLKNSTGFSYQGSNQFQNWQSISGTFTQYIGNDAVDSGTGFQATDGDMKQVIPCVVGQSYTVTCKVKKGTAGTGYLKVSDGNTYQQVNLSNAAAYNYTTIQISGFVPATGTLIIEIEAAGVTGGLIFTAIMVNVGTVGLQWCHALGELYNTNVQMDINGLKVFSNQYNGYTIMSPQEFSGYFMNNQGVMQKVFTLNKDTTQVAKLQVNDPNQPEIDMGDLRMINVNGGGYDGWAIVGTS